MGRLQSKGGLEMGHSADPGTGLHSLHLKVQSAHQGGGWGGVVIWLVYGCCDDTEQRGRRG